MAYRQIDFERVADDRAKGRQYGEHKEVIEAALRIASAVARAKEAGAQSVLLSEILEASNDSR